MKKMQEAQALQTKENEEIKRKLAESQREQDEMKRQLVEQKSQS